MSFLFKAELYSNAGPHSPFLNIWAVVSDVQWTWALVCLRELLPFPGYQRRSGIVGSYGITCYHMETYGSYVRCFEEFSIFKHC
jgi:hypothetical protein